MPRTWVDGVETVLTEAEWARRAAAFLGCGFRVVVPSGPVRAEALADARRQAIRIAELFDATFDEAPWQAAASCEDPVELVGGWRHQFRGPAGASTTRVSKLAERPPSVRHLSSVRLPWALNAHSPMTGLPMISGLEESQAVRALTPDTAGLWWNTDGHLTSSTAGPLLLRMHGEWAHPPLDGGTVPHLVWCRVAEQLAARELPFDDQVVSAPRRPPTGSRHQERGSGVRFHMTSGTLCAVDPLGHVTVLNEGTQTDELLSAVDAVLHHI